MALMSVDLPQPLGPRIATCSPTPIRRETSFNASVSPRITDTLWNSIRAGVNSPCYSLKYGDAFRNLAGAAWGNRMEPVGTTHFPHGPASDARRGGASGESQAHANGAHVRPGA